MAGPFYPPNPTQFPVLPNKSERPGAATYAVDASAVGGTHEANNGLQYNLNPPVNEVQHGAGNDVGLAAYGYEDCGTKDEEGEATTNGHQDGVYNHTETMNPNPVDQGHGVYQAQNQTPPTIAPYDDPSLDLTPDPCLNIPAEVLANVDIDNSWFDNDAGVNVFDSVRIPEVSEGGLLPAGQEVQQPPPNQQETTESGPKFEGNPSTKLEDLPAHGATIDGTPSEEVKPPASTNYFENGIEYQEAKPEPEKKEETKPKKPRKKQNRNKAPRQNSAAARDDPENYTLPMVDQMHWSIDNLPDILYQFKPVGEKGVRPREKKPSPYPGEKDLTVFPILPDRISSNIEEFRLEAWQRLDRRIELKDISARIIPRCRPTHNAIQQRTVRFRKAMKMVSWGSGNKKTPILGARVLRQMIQKGIDPAKNSTRGLTPGLIDPSRGEAGGRIPAPKHYKEKKDNAPPPPQSYIDLGLPVPSHVIEAWDLRLTPYEYAVALQHQVPGGWYGILQIALVQKARGPEFGPFNPSPLHQPGFGQQALPPRQSQSQTQPFNTGFLPSPAFGQQALPATQSQGFNAGPLPRSAPIQQSFPTPQNQALNAGIFTGSTAPPPTFPAHQSLGGFSSSPVLPHTGMSTAFGQTSYNNRVAVKEEGQDGEIIAESVENLNDRETEETEEEAGSEDHYDEGDEDKDEIEDDDEDEYEDGDEDHSDDADDDDTEDYQPTDDDSSNSSERENDDGESGNESQSNRSTEERQSSESRESTQSNENDQVPQTGHASQESQPAQTSLNVRLPQSRQTIQATCSTESDDSIYCALQSIPPVPTSLNCQTPLTSQASQTNQTVQGSQDGDSASFDLMGYYALLLPNADLTGWEDVLDYNRIDLDDIKLKIQASDDTVPTPVPEERSNNEGPESYFHTLEYWDEVYSTKEFGDFGHQAVLVPDSPPLLPPARPGRPQPTTREAIIRAQTERTQHPRPMTNDTIQWGNTILTNDSWVPNMPSLTDYEGQASFEAGLESIGHHPHLSPSEPAFWDQSFLPSRALAGYTYSEPHIQVGTTLPTLGPQPRPQSQIQSQNPQRPLFEIVRKRRDENDHSVNRGQARDRVKRRRLEGDGSMERSRQMDSQPYPAVARAIRYINSSPTEQSLMEYESVLGRPYIRIPSSENGYLPVQPRAQTSIGNGHTFAQSRIQTSRDNDHMSVQPRTQTSMGNGYTPVQSRAQTTANNGYVFAQPQTQTSMRNGYTPRPRVQTSASNGYMSVQARSQATMDNGYASAQARASPVSTSNGYTGQPQHLYQPKRKRESDAPAETSGTNSVTKRRRLEDDGSEMPAEFH